MRKIQPKISMISMGIFGSSVSLMASCGNESSTQIIFIESQEIANKNTIKAKVNCKNCPTEKALETEIKEWLMKCRREIPGVQASFPNFVQHD